MSRILEDVSTGSVVETEETKAEAFRRLANKRVSVVLDKLRIVGNLSNRSIYEFTDEQVDAIERAVQDELAMIMRQFRKEKVKKTFSI